MTPLSRATAGFVFFALAACSRRDAVEPAPRPARAVASAGSATPASAAAASPTTASPTTASRAPSAPLRFAVIGDFGADSASEAEVARLVKSWSPAFVITTGDNNYPRGEAATIDVNIGKHYGEYIGRYKGSFGSGSPENRFWPSLGNHDWITPGASPYLAYFTLPGNERYYDVDLGLVHLYALDSDPREPDGIGATSTQAQWLSTRLAASRSCYDVVYFHHPAYSSGPHGSAMEMRWPFRAWGAEVVMAGHDHTYERFDVEGIPYFVNGLGGASRYEFAAERSEPTKHSERRYNEGYGAMLVTVTPSAIEYEFLTVDGQRRDRLNWPKPPGDARCTGTDASP